MAQKQRKIRKKLGQRTGGHGSHKKNRGAGNRGGTGKAGGLKGKYTYITKTNPRYFGRYGFKLPSKVRTVYTSINVGELDEKAEQLVKEGKARKGKKGIEVDVEALGYEKVLGKGKVNKALVVRAPRFSGSAEKKLEEAGGKAVTPE